MKAELAPTLAFLVLSSGLAAQNSAGYRIINGNTDSDGLPTTAARLCIGSDRAQNCFTPPAQDPPFGLHAKAQEVQVATGATMILFTAESSSGGSGSLTILALLATRNGHLENLLPKVTVTNQSEYRLWSLPDISAMPVLVTADFVWADGETHFAHHRYRITTFVYHKLAGRYVQRDQFVTTKKYPGLDDVDAVTVLEPEKNTILARLK